MGVFTGSSRRKKSVQAQINKVLRQIEKKKARKKLADLRKQLRGY